MYKILKKCILFIFVNIWPLVNVPSGPLVKSQFLCDASSRAV